VARLSRHDLYDLCVTSPRRFVPFLRAVHGGSPRVLREDFAGGAAVAKAWPGMVPKGRAIAVDVDPKPLARCRGIAGVRAIASDVLTCHARADIITATNFPLGYWHDRGSLVTYLRRCAARLTPGGVFVADLYGGSESLKTGTFKTKLRAPEGDRIVYTWEQREFSHITMRATNAMHFRVTPRRGRVYEYRDAFTYDWRVWSIPEFTDAAHDAGFARVEVYDRLADAIDSDGGVMVRPVDGELDDPFVVYVVGRT
jgi:SAM-dependent methyltransferase